MAFSLFSQKVNLQRRIVMDISSGSVGGAVVYFKKNSKPTIEYSYRSPLPIRARVDAKSLMTDTEKAIGKVVEQIRLNSKFKITDVDVICASPWFSARTKSLTYEKPEAFTVTEKLIKEISLKESVLMKAEMESGMLSIEERIAHIRLNGYESDSPLGKKVKRLDLMVFASFIPKDFAEQVIHCIEALVPAKKVVFHSMPFISFHALSRIWRGERQFAFLHVGAEISEFILVDNSSITETLSFPVGVNHLVRSIAEKQEINRELAESHLGVFGRGSSDASANKRMDKDLASVKEEWLVYIDQVIRESLPDHQSVQKMYISAEGDTLSFWLKAISPHVQNVLPLNAESLEHFVDHAGTSKPDLFLSIISLYIDCM